MTLAGKNPDGRGLCGTGRPKLPGPLWESANDD